eukprot:g9601.t1
MSSVRETRTGAPRREASNYNGFQELSVDRGSSVLDRKNVSRILRSTPSSPGGGGVKIPSGNIINLTRLQHEELALRYSEKQQLIELIRESKRELAESKRKFERQKKQSRMLAAETIRFENETKRVAEELELLHRENTGLDRTNRKATAETKQLAEDNKSIMLALYEAAKTKRETEEYVNEARKAYFAEADARRAMMASLRLHEAKCNSHEAKVKKAVRQRDQLEAAILGTALSP